jgi:hypothetical protein
MPVKKIVFNLFILCSNINRPILKIVVNPFASEINFNQVITAARKTFFGITFYGTLGTYIGKGLG